ncbi:MAG: DUF1643 domain-containing protein [Actinobacteria bacterium]|nr:DUF1643 domain-containing protein [Actinomycetota bacterium]
MIPATLWPCEPDPLLAYVPAGQVLDVVESRWGVGTATFSTDQQYRYRLSRIFADSGQRVCFVMLNPSTADAATTDPTVERCLRFARLWGAGEVEVVNLFALRSTDPRALYNHADPVGPGNDDAIAAAAACATTVVAAWGVHGALHGRGEAVSATLQRAGVRLVALGQTKDGHPRHPLYLAGSTVPADYHLG